MQANSGTLIKNSGLTYRSGLVIGTLWERPVNGVRERRSVHVERATTYAGFWVPVNTLNLDRQTPIYQNVQSVTESKTYIVYHPN